MGLTKWGRSDFVHPRSEIALILRRALLMGGVIHVRGGAIALLLRHESSAEEIPDEESADDQDRQTSYGASDYWTDV